MRSLVLLLVLCLFASVVAAADQPSPRASDHYATAYQAAQSCGKLCVLVTTSNCEPCELAKLWFGKMARDKSAGACVILDAETDAKYVADIADDFKGYPQLIVYRDLATSPRRECLVGWQAISSRGLVAVVGMVIDDDSRGVAAVPAEQLVEVSHSADTCKGCRNCPSDCSAHGCHCAGSHAAGACGAGCGLVRGQPVRNIARAAAGAAVWVKESKPVRRAVAGVAIGSAKVVRAVVWRAFHPLGGRCRGCR
jgi:hypothetical protein